MMTLQGGKIKRHVFLMLFGTSSTVLLLLTFLFSVHQYQLFERGLYANLEVQSRIVADHSQAALLFEDKEEANRLLQALQYDTGIMQAFIVSTLDKQSHVLARYKKQPTSHNFIALDKTLLGDDASVQQTSDYVVHIMPIKANANIIGYVVLYASFLEFYDNLYADLIIIVAISAISLLLALFLSYIFCARLSSPIMKLMHFMMNVSSKGDYTVQYTVQSFDELNALSASFNDLLKRIGMTINEREEARAALIEHNNQLADKVARRTQQLEKAKSLAEASSDAKSAFLANMSHEVRTPMNAILGFSKVLQAQVESENQKQQLDYVIDSGHLLMSMMDDMLDFSRIEANKIILEHKDFNLLNELTMIYQIIINKVDTQAVRLLFEVDPAIPTHLIGDSLRLNQVLLNLLANAVKFTQQGVVRLVIKLGSLDDQEAKLNFAVYDTGIGIALDKQENLFDPFTQVDVSITRKYGGVGLGLSICYSLVKLMGGDLLLQSDLNIGSEFSFSLDLKYVSDQKPLFTNEMVLPPKIILVESYAQYADYLALVIQSFDIELQVCRTAESFMLLIATLPKQTCIMISDEILYEQCIAQGLESLLQENNLVAFLLLYANPKKYSASSAVFKMVRQPILEAKALYNEFNNIPGHSLENEPSNPLILNHINPDVTLLLVDDVVINRELIAVILEERIGTLLQANNGQEAIDIMTQQTVDLVFMDIQMPVLDGYQATTFIREELQSTVPIIGMTAFASETDQQKCLAVGMNEVLVKPIDLQCLEGVLSRYIGFKSSKDDGVLTLPDNLPHLEGIDVADGLQRIGHNKARYYNLLAIFYETYKLAGYQLLSFILEAEWFKIESLSHEIKGAAANLGMKNLAKICEQLFTASKAQHLSGELQQDFLIVLERTLVSLEPIYQHDKSAQPISLPVSEASIHKDKLLKIETILKELVEKTEQHSFECIHLLTTLKGLCGNTYSKQQYLLDEALEKFQFQYANKCVVNWLHEIALSKAS